MAHTHPFVPTRNGHLRVVDPDAGRRVDTTDPRRPGNQFTPDGDRDARVTAQSSAVHTAGTNGPMPGNVRRLEPGRPRPGKAHETYRHECVLYAGTDGFLDAAVPFVRDGLARQEPVMVAVAEPRLRALRSALGEDAERVVFADMADLGHNPALIIPAWRDFTDRHSGPGRPVRGIGEPIWATRQPEEIAEAQLHEALLNMAVPPDVPLWLLCPYDTTTLGKEVLAEAHRSHPVIVRGNDYRGSTSYGGTVHIDTLFHRPLPDPAGPVTGIVFDRDRHRHIEQLIRHARTAGLPPADAVKLAVAVHEIAAAAYHDTGDVRIRLWTDRAALLCDITDPGRITDPMIGRTGSSSGTARDRAAGLANQLCDLVQIRCTPDGTAARLHIRSGTAGR